MASSRGDGGEQSVNIEHVESAARRKLKASEGWKGHTFECVGEDYIVTGSVPGGKKRNGTPKWAGEGEKAIVTRAEAQDEIKRYERETKNCSICLGKKEVLARWSVVNGLELKPCKACGATGLAKGE